MTKPGRRPKVAVIVVSYNSAGPLPGLLDSLPGGLSGLDWSLTVADNDSADASIALAEAAIPGCRAQRRSGRCR